MAIEKRTLFFQLQPRNTYFSHVIIAIKESGEQYIATRSQTSNSTFQPSTKLGLRIIALPGLVINGISIYAELSVQEK